MIVRAPPLGMMRNFEPSDLDAITRLANDSMTEFYTSDIIYEIYLSWPSGIKVYQSNDTILGFIAGSKYTRTEARILLLAVREGYRKLGIGSLLIDGFMNQCREENFLSVRLEVRTDNHEAIKFYRKYNFSITHTLPSYYSDFSDALLMWRML